MGYVKLRTVSFDVYSDQQYLRRSSLRAESVHRAVFLLLFCWLCAAMDFRQKNDSWMKHLTFAFHCLHAHQIYNVGISDLFVNSASVLGVRK